MRRTLSFAMRMPAASACILLCLVPRALAWSGGSEAAAGAHFLLNGPAATPVRGVSGYLGVDVRDVAADQIGMLKLKDARGAEIVLVDHDAPAGKAGLREHDVVLQMNGQAIEGRDQIRRMIHECAPGKTVVLVISRDGQQLSVTAQLATQEQVERQALEHLTVPDPQASSSDSASSDFSLAPAPPAPAIHGNSFIGTLLMNPSYTGAMLEKMSSQLAGYFGAAGGSGLLVRSVEPNSPAANAGMQAGDVVLKADTHAVASTNDWAKAIKNSHGHPLPIVVLRDKKELILTLTPDGKKRSSIEQPDSPTLAHLGFSLLPR